MRNKNEIVSHDLRSPPIRTREWEFAGGGKEKHPIHPSIHPSQKHDAVVGVRTEIMYMGCTCSGIVIGLDGMRWDGIVCTLLYPMGMEDGVCGRHEDERRGSRRLPHGNVVIVLP